MAADGIRLYDPTAEPRATAARLAPRLASLAGTRAGILDNGTSASRSSAEVSSTRPTRWSRS